MTFHNDNLHKDNEVKKYFKQLEDWINANICYMDTSDNAKKNVSQTELEKINSIIKLKDKLSHIQKHIGKKSALINSNPSAYFNYTSIEEIQKSLKPLLSDVQTKSYAHLSWQQSQKKLFSVKPDKSVAGNNAKLILDTWNSKEPLTIPKAEEKNIVRRIFGV